MAGSLNIVQLIGNLGAAPEIRSVGDAKVANFRIACTESWKDRQSGEKKERTEWVSVVVWGDGLVGVIEKYVSKGSRIYVQGQLQTRKWTDDKGADRYTTEVVVRVGGKVLLLDGKRDGGGAHSGGANSGGSSSGGYSGGSDYASDLDDDQIPF